jgi:hypothetical protein
MRMIEGRSTAAAALAMLLCSASVLAAGAPAAAGAGRPEVIQLSYFESSGDQGPDRRLEAFARHTHAMRFATTYGGRRASAPGRYRSDITDTDIRGREAKHPWTPDRKEGGGKVIRLVHRSLHDRGFATVRLRARNAGESNRVRVRIDRSDCASDPPLYPVDCEIRV